MELIWILKKLINIEACYENSVLLNFTLCPGGTVSGQQIHLVTKLVHRHFLGKHTVKEDSERRKRGDRNGSRAEFKSQSNINNSRSMVQNQPRNFNKS